MKITAQRLKMLMDIGTVGGLIDPVEIDFGEDCAKQEQVDTSGVVAVYARYAPEFFTQYEAIGTVQIPARDFNPNMVRF